MLSTARHAQGRVRTIARPLLRDPARWLAGVMFAALVAVLVLVAVLNVGNSYINNVVMTALATARSAGSGGSSWSTPPPGGPEVLMPVAEPRVAFERPTLITPAAGRALVKDLTVTVPPHLRLLVTGPNGAGKTAPFRGKSRSWRPARCGSSCSKGPAAGTSRTKKSTPSSGT